MVQQVRLTSVILASHMGPGSCPVFSPTNMAPTYGPGKAVEVGPVLGPPPIHIGNLDEVPGFGLWSGSTLALAVIGGIN